MTGRIFVDTNILVYARDRSVPEKHELAAAFLRGLWTERTGVLSVQVLNEYYVTVTRKLKPGMAEASAWEDVELLGAWNPLPLDSAMQRKARDVQIRYGLSWWDSLIVAGAAVGNCSAIASEDLNAGQTYFGIRVFDPLGQA